MPKRRSCCPGGAPVQQMQPCRRGGGGGQGGGSVSRVSAVASQLDCTHLTHFVQQRAGPQGTGSCRPTPVRYVRAALLRPDLHSLAATPTSAPTSVPPHTGAAAATRPPPSVPTSVCTHNPTPHVVHLENFLLCVHHQRVIHADLHTRCSTQQAVSTHPPGGASTTGRRPRSSVWAGAGTETALRIAQHATLRHSIN